MPTPTVARLRSPLVILLALALAVVLVPATAHPAGAAADHDVEAEFVQLLNEARTSRGLPALQLCSQLRRVARDHSARMAATDNLHHNPDLSSDVDDWRRLAENVGVGGSAASLHHALMNSDGHRRNILDSRVSQLGIGVETAGSRVWVTQVFRQPASGADCDDPTRTRTTTTSAPRDSEGARLTGDFTGDGRDDVARYDSSTGSWLVTHQRDGQSVTERWARFATRTGWAEHLAGDFDGDGADDLASYHPGTGRWYVSRSTGGRFVTEAWTRFRTRTGWSDQLAGDFDGDGADDLVSYHAGAGTWWVSQSDGRGFATTHWASFDTRRGWSDHLVGDFQGRGREGVASYHASADSWWLLRSTGSLFTLLGL